jgi:hypothetical protein
VTTATEDGVATPWITTGGGGATATGIELLLDPPQAAMAPSIASVQVARQSVRCMSIIKKASKPRVCAAARDTGAIRVFSVTPMSRPGAVAH